MFGTPIGNDILVTSPMTSRDLKGQGRDPDIKNAHYFENGWR